MLYLSSYRFIPSKKLSIDFLYLLTNLIECMAYSYCYSRCLRIIETHISINSQHIYLYIPDFIHLTFNISID